METKTNGLVEDCSNSSAIAMELLQSCTEPLKSSSFFLSSVNLWLQWLLILPGILLWRRCRQPPCPPLSSCQPSPGCLPHKGCSWKKYFGLIPKINCQTSKIVRYISGVRFTHTGNDDWCWKFWVGTMIAQISLNSNQRYCIFWTTCAISALRNDYKKSLHFNVS